MADHIHLKEIPKIESIERLMKPYSDVDPLIILHWLHFIAVATGLCATMSTFFSSRGLSEGRFAVLIHLKRTTKKGLTPSDLSESLGVTRATITGLLDGLERDNLVERQQDSKDRRSIRIMLTPKAIELLAELLPIHFSRIEVMMSKLTSQDQKQLAILMQKMLSGISTLEELETKETF